MRKLQGRFAAILFLLFLVWLSVASAQDTTRVAGRERYDIERYLNIRGATAPTLSPAGDRIAFLTSITGTPQVWMVGAEGGWPEQLTFYADRVDLVKWSPDGSGLVFAKSRGGDENAQLFWLSPDGSKVRQLTDIPKVRHDFSAWSHDGKKISFASNERNRDLFDVYVMDVASGKRELVYQQDGTNRPIAWSVDIQAL